MTPDDFRAWTLRALAGALAESSTRELADASGVGVHNAHEYLRELEASGAIRRVGFRSRSVVWALGTPPATEG